MDTPKVPRKPWVKSLERAGWSIISDRIIHGLSHDLAGRVSSLGGLNYLLESGTGDPGSVLPFMNQELGELEDVVRLLRLLPDDTTEAELLAPGEIIGDLVFLVRAQRGLENVDVEMDIRPDAPAARLDRTFFIRGVVILLTGAAERSVLDGTSRVEVRVSGEGTRLVLEVAPGPGDGDPPEGEHPILPRQALPPERVAIWEETLRGEGVEIRRPGGKGRDDGTLEVIYSLVPA